MTRGGRQAGEEHLLALCEYLRRLAEAGEGVPERAGKANVTAVALACGFNREVLYQNPRCKAVLAEAVVRLGLAKPSADVADDGQDDRARLENRIRTLEQQNAALYAEVHELRRRLRRVEHIEEHFVRTGRRITP